ncbi:hypothetical protein KIAC18_000742 [Sporomusa sphaeroides]|uniref:hypothetical protein n=1 Tax=Sporomusa sphaeroides TaxID=47679 RepID=UPI003DA066FA
MEIVRVRKYRQNAGLPPVERPVKAMKDPVATNEQAPETVPVVLPAKTSQKQKKTGSRGPAAMLRKMMQNPNLNVQMVVILLTLASENFSMDRRIDSMSSTVDKIRNITDVIENTMQSVKVASEAPKQIRRLFETKN